MTVTNRATTACTGQADLFQHPVMDTPVAPGASADERHQAAMMVRKAQNLCAGCPLLRRCLFDAVVRFDVSGFVAGTTQYQRREIRRRLGVTVVAEDLDTLAGVTTPNRQVDHAEIVRLRRANPEESLETLARRLGCSLSTVKRHLRRARTEAGTGSSWSPTTPPEAEQVWAVAREVVGGVRPHQQVAAA